jgi:hypothetical protein
MRICKDGRSQSERRFHPVRRDISRYGLVEKALNELKEEGCVSIYARSVACKTRKLEPMQVASIMQFTRGVARGEKRGCWVFTGEEIRVENSVRVV